MEINAEAVKVHDSVVMETEKKKEATKQILFCDTKISKMMTFT